MKKHLLSQIFLITLIVFAFAACDKGGGEDQKTKTELITQSAWKFDKATAAGFGDVSSYVDACYKDNLITFASNLTGTVSEAAVVCSPSTAGNFTWAFQTNETILNISATLFPGGSSNFTLVTLNETNLVISQDVTLPPPVSITANVVFTLKH